MSKMDDREQAFETKFKKDEEFQFRAEARRNKLLGLWLAEQFGMSGENADNYAKEVIASDFEEPGVEDVIRKVTADIERHGLDISDYLLRKKIDEFMAEAVRQLKEETS